MAWSKKKLCKINTKQKKNYLGKVADLDKNDPGSVSLTSENLDEILDDDEETDKYHEEEMKKEYEQKMIEDEKEKGLSNADHTIQANEKSK